MWRALAPWTAGLERRSPGRRVRGTPRRAELELGAPVHGKNGNMRKSQVATWIAMTCCLAVAGCKKQAAAGAAGGIPPVQVITVEARRQTVWESLSSPGTIAANEQVEIKAETDGIVQEINFAEGERVEKGRMLVKLDETKLAASVAEAEANLKLSQANYDRAQQLFHDK